MSEHEHARRHGYADNAEDLEQIVDELEENTLGRRHDQLRDDQLRDDQLHAARTDDNDHGADADGEDTADRDRSERSPGAEPP